MRGPRIEDQLARHAAGPQRGEPPLRLTHRATHVGRALQDQRRRLHPIDEVHRRHLVEALAIGPRQAAHLLDREQQPHVGGRRDTVTVGDDPARHSRRKPPIARGEVARHVTAIAVARHRQPRRIDQPLRHEIVDRREEVVGVGGPPVAQGRGHEVLSIPVAAARVEQQHGPPGRSEHLVVEVLRVGRPRPRVVRAAVDVQQQRRRAVDVLAAQDPAVDRPPVRRGERPLPGHRPVQLAQQTCPVCRERSQRPVGQIEPGKLPERLGRRDDDHGLTSVGADRQPAHGLRPTDEGAA